MKTLFHLLQNWKSLKAYEVWMWHEWSLFWDSKLKIFYFFLFFRVLLATFPTPFHSIWRMRINHYHLPKPLTNYLPNGRRWITNHEYYYPHNVILEDMWAKVASEMVFDLHCDNYGFLRLGNKLCWIKSPFNMKQGKKTNPASTQRYFNVHLTSITSI